jgi:hypothetical protein
MSEPDKIIEHTTQAETEGLIDGMQDMMGDDILSSDYTLGQPWPGVNRITLPEAYQRPGQVERVPDEK